MSYELDFWKYRPGITLNHQTVYERLSDGQQVDGLEDLPIDDVRNEISEGFREWTQIDADSWESDQAGSFQVFTTPQFVRVDCYGLEDDAMNRFIDILAKHGAALYDPQIAERFGD